MSGQDLVTLNVGGRIFTTRPSTLKQFPASRLAGMLDGRDQEFKTVDGQIFVDRDGALFSFILDFLRNHELLLPSDFADHHRLQREALFYELDSLVDLLSQFLLQSRSAVMEVHFLNQNTQAFFRVFGSCSKTIEMLSGRITMFVERPTALTGNRNSPLALPPQRPSHHDLLFHCGSDGAAENQAGVRYISIKPDNRKLANGTNVLGLLVDTLLKEGFHLVSTRTPASGEKSECYVFERITTPQVLGMSKTPKSETTTMPAPSQK
ncbi:potassium channel regulatory protein isoform 1 [Mus musculus]|uniref:Potassium channel regulatory protein n=1 Tax=Mus musculus TaxID=10090 RepID=KCNRG_MOUSE|nr:potassium channel regulatory protein isoform 1 [Mus musculus]Q2TUM3.1 RecName: Full=Potassium channel regulatory protein; Short=Potassium channel regulator; AltName: Full=Protein CLLD4 [Mus musculus]AAI47092.1 Potassium channel regulator [Mus musculus]AAI47093.1 Potassium channel regulator [Mus musculus]AAS72551.1 CLLD4-like protein 29 kDa isoform [Mus musculus]|eukprot:NP_001034194.1 potassium channel regulatory protein isoform 1 [Mus musculus]